MDPELLLGVPFLPPIVGRPREIDDGRGGQEASQAPAVEEAGVLAERDSLAREIAQGTAAGRPHVLGHADHEPARLQDRSARSVYVGHRCEVVGAASVAEVAAVGAVVAGVGPPQRTSTFDFVLGPEVRYLAG